jgi:hypothetical protein
MVLYRDSLLQNVKEVEKNRGTMQWYEDLHAIAVEGDL